MLKVEKITKQFGGVVAIKNVDFEVKQNEIFALVGPNGAGKTTFYNVISGKYQATEGEIFFKNFNPSFVTFNSAVNSACMVSPPFLGFWD